MSKVFVNVTFKKRWWFYPALAIATPFIAMRMIDSRTVAKWLSRHACVHRFGANAELQQMVAIWKAMQTGPTGMVIELDSIGTRKKPAE